MGYALYITHPEVILDPAIPSTRWQLSPQGRARADAFSRSRALAPVRLLIASAETKTMETAELLATSGAELLTGHNFHENDRSSTGVVSAERLEALMDALYAEPDISPAGWETAAASRARVVRAVSEAIAAHGDRAPLAFIGHGTVGTLLKCHLAGRPATRDEDQRRMAHPGGGNVFVFDFPNRRLLSDWAAMEDFRGIGG